MDAVTLALSASALVALGAGLLSAWLLLSLGDLVARARLLYRPRWRRTLDSLLRHEDEETPDETPRQRNVLAMLPGLAGILLAILVRDWLLSLYLVTLGLSLIWLMRSRQGRKEQAKLTDQVKMLVVLFRSHFAVGGSPFSVLSEVEPELPAGRLRAAARRTVDIYHTTGKVKEALNAMRKLDNPYLARLVMVMEAASVSSTEVVLDELKRLEGDLKARDRLRAQAKASLALLKGTTRFLQVANLTAVAISVVLPVWRDFFTSTLQRRGTFLAATLFMLMASLYFDQEIGLQEEKVL